VEERQKNRREKNQPPRRNKQHQSKGRKNKSDKRRRGGTKKKKGLPSGVGVKLVGSGNQICTTEGGEGEPDRKGGDGGGMEGREPGQVFS